jgi:hypothetical protein
MCKTYLQKSIHLFSSKFLIISSKAEKTEKQKHVEFHLSWNKIWNLSFSIQKANIFVSFTFLIFHRLLQTCFVLFYIKSTLLVKFQISVKWTNSTVPPPSIIIISNLNSKSREKLTYNKIGQKSSSPNVAH